MKLGPFNISIKRNNIPVSTGSTALFDAFGIIPSAVNANVTTAQALSAYYQGTRLIAGDIASLPLHLYRKEPDGDITPISNSVLSQLLKYEIDPLVRVTPYKFFELTLKSLQNRGNSYAIIHGNPSAPTRIEWIKPSDVTLYKDDITGEPFYQIFKKTGNLANGYFSSSQILHFKGLGDDQYQGISVLKYAAKSLGIELASQGLEAMFFENGSIVRDYISTPNALTEEGYKRTAENIKNTAGGTKKGSVLVLDNGGKYETVRINAEDFQFVSRYGKSIGEVARWLNVAPYKLFSLEKMSYSSMEQASADYALQTLAPWCKNIEQEINLKLCNTQKGEYVKFNLDALIRADAISKADSLVKLVNGGILTQNEARKLYEQNNIADASSLLYPLNSIPMNQVKAYYEAKIAGMIKGGQNQNTTGL